MRLQEYITTQGELRDLSNAQVVAGSKVLFDVIARWKDKLIQKVISDENIDALERDQICRKVMVLETILTLPNEARNILQQEDAK